MNDPHRQSERARHSSAQPPASGPVNQESTTERLRARLGVGGQGPDSPRRQGPAFPALAASVRLVLLICGAVLLVAGALWGVNQWKKHSARIAEARREAKAEAETAKLALQRAAIENQNVENAERESRAAVERETAQAVEREKRRKAAALAKAEEEANSAAERAKLDAANTESEDRLEAQRLAEQARQKEMELEQARAEELRIENERIALENAGADYAKKAAADYRASLEQLAAQLEPAQGRLDVANAFMRSLQAKLDAAKEKQAALQRISPKPKNFRELTNAAQKEYERTYAEVRDALVHTKEKQQSAEAIVEAAKIAKTQLRQLDAAAARPAAGLVEP